MKTAYYILKLIIKALLSLKKKTEGIEMIVQKLPFQVPNTFFIFYILSKSENNALIMQCVHTDEKGDRINTNIEVSINDLTRAGILDEAKLIALAKAKVLEKSLTEK